MSISLKLNERSGGVCELCNNLPALHEYIVSPRAEEIPDNQVAICDACLVALSEEDKGDYWRCLEGSIWNPEPSIQALSYRLIQSYKDEEWAKGVLNAVELDEDTMQWAMSAYEVADVHKDAFGNLLEGGDSILLTQNVKVKGTNFTAGKGTMVRKIRLDPDNPAQIEGKINDQTIVILTKFVKKV